MCPAVQISRINSLVVDPDGPDGPRRGAEGRGADGCCRVPGGQGGVGGDRFQRPWAVHADATIDHHEQSPTPTRLPRPPRLRRDLGRFPSTPRMVDHKVPEVTEPEPGPPAGLASPPHRPAPDHRSRTTPSPRPRRPVRQGTAGSGPVGGPAGPRDLGLGSGHAGRPGSGRGQSDGAVPMTTRGSWLSPASPRPIMGSWPRSMTSGRRTGWAPDRPWVPRIADPIGVDGKSGAVQELPLGEALAGLDDVMPGLGVQEFDPSARGRTCSGLWIP